jgi:hypothetical protein
MRTAKQTRCRAGEGEVGCLSCYHSDKRLLLLKWYCIVISAILLVRLYSMCLCRPIGREAKSEYLQSMRSRLDPSADFWSLRACMSNYQRGGSERVILLYTLLMPRRRSCNLFSD